MPLPETAVLLTCRLLCVALLSASCASSFASGPLVEAAPPAASGSQPPAESADQPAGPEAGTAPGRVPADAEPAPDDAERAAKATRALSGIRGLQRPAVVINGDAAVITGIADDQAVLDRAASAVRAAAGVSEIQNDIELTGDFGERLKGASTRLTERTERWRAVLPLVPVAVLIVVAAVVLARLLARWRWLFARFSSNPFLQDIARGLAQAAIIIVGLLVALELIGATALVGGVLGAAGVAGIAIGFAFRDLVENYIASVLLSVRRPFKPKDHVIIDAHEGLVTSMNSRTTVLTTFDGNIVRIPNATVFKSSLVNYSADPRRRFDFTVGVGYDVDLAQAVDVGVEVVRGTPGVLAEPAPFAIVTKLGDSSITVHLFGWVDQQQADFGKARSLAMQRVKTEYDRLDIDMPEPIYSVKLSRAGKPGPGGRPGHAAASASQTGEHDVTPDHTAVEMAEAGERAASGKNLLGEGDAKPE